jgi:hypothetical protein
MSWWSSTPTNPLGQQGQQPNNPNGQGQQGQQPINPTVQQTNNPTGQKGTNNKIITFKDLTPQQQTKLQSLGITSNNVKNNSTVEHSAIPFQSYSTELLLDTSKQPGQPQNLIYMGKVWKSTLPQNQQVQPVQQTSTNNKSNNNKLLNTYQGAPLLHEEKYVFMLENGDFVLNKLIPGYWASSNIKCKLRMKDGKPVFKYINKEKTTIFNKNLISSKKNIANNLFYYIFDIDDSLFGSQNLATEPASTGWGSWFGSPQAQPAAPQEQTAMAAQPATGAQPVTTSSWGWGGKKNIQIKKPKTMKEKPKTKKVNSKTMKEKPITKKVNSKTMKEKSKSKKVESKTMKEKSKTKKVNSKTMKEKSKKVESKSIKKVESKSIKKVESKSIKKVESKSINKTKPTIKKTKSKTMKEKSKTQSKKPKTIKKK